MFGLVRDYNSMLNRIFYLNVLGLCLVVQILAWYWPLLSSSFGSIFPVMKLPGVPEFQAAVLLPAVLIALPLRIMRFHDQVSDLLGIRERFDIDHIILPLASRVGVRLSVEQVGRLSSSRDEIMRKTFYAYASSTEPCISGHLIQMALDRWSWFWWLLEFTVIMLAVDLLLTWHRGYDAGIVFGVAIFVALVSMVVLYRRAARFAGVQIQAILDVEGAEKEIAAVLAKV